MKIAKAVRDLHAEQLGRFDRLKAEVNDTLKPLAESKGWFFYSRLKELTSFALKLETGRVTDPSGMEDFLGCTIVVPNLVHVETAEMLVQEHYDLAVRRPPSDSETLKDASDFRFDDLRLYLRRRPSNSGRNADLVGMVFEVQIKTALQYAWGVATHDLTYKTDSVSWPRERIAFQIKAMLEHVEIAISEAEQLAVSPSISKRNTTTANILKVIEHLQMTWKPDRLPKDQKRLAENVWKIMDLCGLQAEQLNGIVKAEIRRMGILPADLSPYAFIIQALAHSEETKLKKLLTSGRVHVLIHEGMDLPEWMSSDLKGVITI